MSRPAAVAVADRVHVALASSTALGGQPAAGDEAAGLPPWWASEHRAVRVLLRQLLTEVAGPEAGATPIAALPGGRPFLPERPDLTVSLSHSGRWMAAAVGVGPEVGVDVQVPQPASAALLRRCCRPAALAALAGMPQRRRDLEFAWIWTAQEACVKATGAGLAGLPWTIPVEVGQCAGTWQGVRWVSLRDRFSIPLSCAYRPPAGERAVAP